MARQIRGSIPRRSPLYFGGRDRRPKSILRYERQTEAATAWFHFAGIAGGHCGHRYFGGLVAAGLEQAKLKALDTQCKSNLHQWAIAWTSYVEDNNNSFSTGTSVLWARGEWLVALDQSYGKKPDLLFCPRATLRRRIPAARRRLCLSTAQTPWTGEVRPPAGPRRCRSGQPAPAHYQQLRHEFVGL